MTTTAPPTAPPDESPPAPPHALWALLRNTWRGLTSMRTALVLLFLLAVAALPGALLPQRSLNQRLVTQYFTDHPTLAPLLDDLKFFDVFAAPWFAAVYLLLMISLVGCLVPRTVEQIRGLRTPPVAIPRNLSRLPHALTTTLDEPAGDVEARVRRRLRGWQVRWRDEPGPDSAHPVRTVSAERGRMHEVGNLVFHLSLLGLLVAFAAGKMFGYEGQVIVLSGGGQFCNTGILGYDSFRAGLRVDGTDLQPFCVRVDDFTATYEATGQPASFTAGIGYQTAADLAAGTDAWRPTTIAVNHPLRTDGSRLYLLGHGYAPRFTVTYPDGRQRTGEVQWRPVDQTTLLSEGATKFARPGVTDEEQRRTSQLAVTGLLAPTSSGGQVVTSVFPALDDPEVAVDVLRGDLGLDDGRGQSIFTVDRSKLDTGELTRAARKNMRPGDEITLDDGTRVRFDGVRDWVSLQVSHDPAQVWVLTSAVFMLTGLMLSLAVRRRRFWVRLTPTGAGETRVELGGLARTDRAGYGEEFDRLTAAVLGTDPDGPGADSAGMDMQKSPKTEDRP
ncbi:cytochrome c biogenesis protein ResB [Pseudonocardia charpentierae]|uniref:Cytochrome c biogenesis protein ResB n=1 Tax=Pseudonocardia charpentierae TaxID=3075545 RepID=A0ABU2N3L6_9PSEU|nr:cytochrome c biogenesis protein ResB [Pseudonocardia sp. DSM 45834]MDT0348512.1 cytochrome c biogenesis protein ResB [Pseudonocardia sp. DSM 45834]